MLEKLNTPTPEGAEKLTVYRDVIIELKVAGEGKMQLPVAGCQLQGKAKYSYQLPVTCCREYKIQGPVAQV